MAIAEGRQLPFVGPESIDVPVLETFPYEGPDQEIVTETNEFSAVCPYSGLPDFARLTISYVPGTKCVELKSLKFYLQSYRNQGIFYEHVTNTILDDLVAVIEPRWMRIEAAFNARGGMTETVKAKYTANN